MVELKLESKIYARRFLVFGRRGKRVICAAKGGEFRIRQRSSRSWNGVAFDDERGSVSDARGR
jgi:hypothetical protein